MNLNFLYVVREKRFMLKRIDGSTISECNNFTEMELNLFLYIVKKVGLSKQEHLNISLRELLSQQIIEEQTNQYQFISNFTKKARIIYYHINQGWKELDMPFFTLLSYDRQRNTLEISVNSVALPALIDIYKNWTVEDIILNNQLSSDYARAFFTLFKYSEDKEIDITVDELKYFLFLDDMPESYALFGKFYQMVIAPAIAEVAPLFGSVAVEKIRTGRVITHLKFILKHKR